MSKLLVYVVELVTHKNNKQRLIIKNQISKKN